jgi:hypothetical protein
MKPVELELDDRRVITLQKSLIKDAKIMRVFQVKDEFRPNGFKLEVHYLDPIRGLCKTVMACRGRYSTGNVKVT